MVEVGGCKYEMEETVNGLYFFWNGICGFLGVCDVCGGFEVGGVVNDDLYWGCN